ncbi:putative rhamnogalacturonate lyase, galactose mutarotase-like domain-containing protein [Rosa chinensis]|uniref:Putative rhamnogalacturonate lyase, galactose mutarotase-like domain-containing protein n=1 Tax=Rosa chinensis TaxID=74649 RepID=A0A2P6RIW4_ROSCH|nr:putative rhamnogalacturonate lyase, galactose mutarotase-like domain-containing protein [Rosa chinensis]
MELWYGGIDNLLAINNEEGDRGYWDVVWSNPGETKNTQYRLHGTQFKVITARPDQVEVSFITTYNASLNRGVTVPVNVDKRYIMQRGRSGFYTYAIFERLEGWPGGDMQTLRVAYKLHQAKFRYMALSDTRQRFMPTADDRARGRPLAFKEVVLLNNETSSPEFEGEVDDKYQYSAEDKDIKVHGWISIDDHSPPVGFWMITPSDEFRMGGPFKQDLTSHVGPTSLTMFSSHHYVGKKVGLKFQEGEVWKKVFGPVFIYLHAAARNSANKGKRVTSGSVSAFLLISKTDLQFPLPRSLIRAKEFSSFLWNHRSQSYTSIEKEVHRPTEYLLKRIFGLAFLMGDAAPYAEKNLSFNIEAKPQSNSISLVPQTKFQSSKVKGSA